MLNYKILKILKKNYNWKLKKLIKEYLYEQLYEARCVLRSDSDRNITKKRERKLASASVAFPSIFVILQVGFL